MARDGDRVRLVTRGGYDWTGRFPWIVEAARMNRHQQFAIDGEAVVLGADGISDFNALHSRRHDDEVQLYAFDYLALETLPLTRPTSRVCSRAGRMASTSKRLAARLRGRSGLLRFSNEGYCVSVGLRSTTRSVNAVPLKYTASSNRLGLSTLAALERLRLCCECQKVLQLKGG